MKVLLKKVHAFLYVFTEIISRKVFTASLITKLSINLIFDAFCGYGGSKHCRKKCNNPRKFFFCNAGYLRSPNEAPKKVFYRSYLHLSFSRLIYYSKVIIIVDKN